MDTLVISKDDLKNLIEALMKKMVVYGPVRKQQSFTFSSLSSFDELDLSYTRTTLPPKKLLFPQRETLFTFKRGQGEEVSDSDIASERQCIVGVHPCDIHGISLMDKVFSSDYDDPYYIAKREKTIIIGVDCMPDEECFCTSLHTDVASSGFDLFLTPVEDRYVVHVGSKKGEELVRGVGGPTIASSEDIDTVRRYREEKKKTACTSINADHRSLPLLYAGAFELDVWKKHADRCFGCGSCIMVCPTCYCFNVEDSVELDLQSGKRERIWDGCMLSGFAQVGTGENFRKSVADRLRHRFNRKFQFHMVEYGALFCIGCGRCGRACLAEIKPAEVTNEIIEAKKV